jgi:hypothetical protein
MNHRPPSCALDAPHRPWTHRPTSAVRPKVEPTHRPAHPTDRRAATTSNRTVNRSAREPHTVAPTAIAAARPHNLGSPVKCDAHHWSGNVRTRQSPGGRRSAAIIGPAMGTWHRPQVQEFSSHPGVLRRVREGGAAFLTAVRSLAGSRTLRLRRRASSSEAAVPSPRRGKDILPSKGLRYRERGGGVFGIVAKSSWRVVSPSPRAGARVKRGTRVTLYVDRDC